MILWGLATALAADPVSLRQLDEDGALVHADTGSVGEAADLGPALLSADYTPGAVAVHAGQRHRLTGVDRRWGFDGLGAVGLAGLTATPGVALVVTGAVRGGLRTDTGQATLGLVVPLALRVDVPPALATPIGLEVRLAVKAGPIWLGGRAQAGPTLTVGGVPAGHASAGGFLQVHPSRD